MEVRKETSTYIHGLEAGEIKGYSNPRSRGKDFWLMLGQRTFEFKFSIRNVEVLAAIIREATNLLAEMTEEKPQ